MSYSKSENMPFRYDFKLERVLNENIPEGSIYENLSTFITEIDNYEPDLVLSQFISVPVGQVDLGNNLAGSIIQSIVDNTTIELSAGTKRNKYYLVVNPTVNTIEIINTNSLPNNLDLPSNLTENMTLFIYTRISETESVISKRLINNYGVQEGAFFAEDFPALDFSIGNIN